MLRPIHIQVIPHLEHRYVTVGDYWDTPDGLEVRVSDMEDAKYEFLVAVHELIESFLCQVRGIPEPEIKAFDEAFEARREPGNTDEPGDDPEAPYINEHKFATYIERQIATELGISWAEYTRVVDAL